MRPKLTGCLYEITCRIHVLACTHFQKMAGLVRVHFIQASNQFEPLIRSFEDVFNYIDSGIDVCTVCFFSKKLFTKQVSNIANWLNRMASEDTGSRWVATYDMNSGLHAYDHMRKERLLPPNLVHREGQRKIYVYIYIYMCTCTKKSV